MNQFGSDEYGNRDSFKLICQKCGKEGKIVAIHHFGNNPKVKIVVEARCSCGNKYGATIHSDC